LTYSSIFITKVIPKKRYFGRSDSSLKQWE